MSLRPSHPAVAPHAVGMVCMDAACATLVASDAEICDECGGTRLLALGSFDVMLYGWDDEVGSNTVEVYIHALRKKLGAAVIRNIRGVGYVVPRLDGEAAPLGEGDTP